MSCLMPDIDGQFLLSHAESCGLSPDTQSYSFNPALRMVTLWEGAGMSILLFHTVCAGTEWQ